VRAYVSGVVLIGTAAGDPFVLPLVARVVLALPDVVFDTMRALQRWGGGVHSV